MSAVPHVDQTIEHFAAQGPVRDRLKDKVVLITGTGGGQGRLTALMFARAGATVVGCGRGEAGLAETRAMAEAEGLRLDQSATDAADPERTRSWIDAAAARYGGIDILYNNAGMLHYAPVAEMTPHQWHETLRNELDAVLFPVQAAWPHLIARGGGSIVNIASLAGMRGIEAASGVAHAAAKGGVIALSRQLALEGAPHRIRCNTVCPGPIYSPGFDTHLGHLKRMAEGWPLLPRIGIAEDVAYAGLFLASDESRWITGINLPVDGGMSSKCGFTEH